MRGVNVLSLELVLPQRSRFSLGEPLPISLNAPVDNNIQQPKKN